MIVKHRVPMILCLALLAGLPAAAQDLPVLELSMADAVQRALENNVDIVVQRFNPLAADYTTKQINGYYEPVVYSVLNKNSTDSPATTAFSGATKVSTQTTVFDFGAAAYLKTGGLLQLGWSNNKQDTNSIFTNFNPAYASTFRAVLSQPLLKNFRIDFNREQLLLAKKTKEITDVQFAETVKNTVANVKNLYYDYIYRIDSLDAARKSLALAQKLLNENQIKVKVGTMAPLDVVEAESEVASREEGVIEAEAALGDAEDALKRSIFPRNAPETWDVHLVPTDRPSAEPIAVDAQAALARALEQRTDVVQLRKRVEAGQVSVDYNKNQLLPQLDFVGTWGGSGIGGDQLIRDTLGGPVVETIPGGWGDAVGSIFDYKTWSVGVNVSYPILNKSAKAATAGAEVLRDQAAAQLRQLELLVAAEIRTDARAVESNMKRVAATRAARILQERRLDAEEKKFAAGMSTNFLVTQAQRDLRDSEVAEIQAISDYRKSIVNYERAQEAGVSGVTSSAISTGTPAANRFAGSPSLQ